MLTELEHKSVSTRLLRWEKKSASHTALRECDGSLTIKWPVYKVVCLQELQGDQSSEKLRRHGFCAWTSSKNNYCRWLSNNFYFPEFLFKSKSEQTSRWTTACLKRTWKMEFSMENAKCIIITVTTCMAQNSYENKALFKVNKKVLEHIQTATGDQ